MTGKHRHPDNLRAPSRWPVLIAAGAVLGVAGPLIVMAAQGVAPEAAATTTPTPTTWTPPVIVGDLPPLNVATPSVTPIVTTAVTTTSNVAYRPQTPQDVPGVSVYPTGTPEPSTVTTAAATATPTPTTTPTTTATTAATTEPAATTVDTPTTTALPTVTPTTTEETVTVTTTTRKRRR